MMRRGDPYWITENVKNVFNIGFQCYWVRFPEGQSEKGVECKAGSSDESHRVPV